MFDLIYPMFAMFLLCLGVMLGLFRMRLRSVLREEVKVSYFKTYQGDIEPRRSAQAARHFSNLFETPVLFYVVCLSALALQPQSIAITALAWSYVVARLAHAIVHMGSNKIKARMVVYFTSWFILVLMWGTLLVGQR